MTANELVEMQKQLHAIDLKMIEGETKEENDLVRNGYGIIRHNLAIVMRRVGQTIAYLEYPEDEPKEAS